MIQIKLPFVRKSTSQSSFTKQYVIVRTDLSKVQQTIQSAHAAVLAESLYSGDCVVYGAATRPLVILQVSNRFWLKLLVHYLKF